jgi:uncharacterized protein (TIGR02996 family)
VGEHDAMETAFIDAIRKNPDDDEARAVYADWLEERGDPRGEYLRLEIQMHRLPLRMVELSAAIAPDWIEVVARRYDVMLDDSGVNKIMVIKSIRMVTGLGLKEAKDLCDAASPLTPARILYGVDLKVGEQAIRELAPSGGTVRLVPHRIDSSRVGYRTDVVLVSVVSSKKLEAIKTLREFTSLGLREAMQLVEAVATGRQVIARGIDPARGAEIASRFGGIAEVALERTYLRT